MDLLLSAVAIFFSALIQSTTGFGFALISIPILSLMFAPQWVIPLVMLISFLTLSINVKSVYKGSDRKLQKRLLLGSLLGLPIGGGVFFYFDVEGLRLLISIVIILITLLLIFKHYFDRWLSKIEKKDWCFGAFSGFLTFSVGLPGPPIMLYLETKKADQVYYRANGIVFLFFIYPFPLTVLLLSGSITMEMVKYLLLLLPVSYLGVLVGNKVHKLISKKFFILITYTILLSTGISLLLRTLL